MKRYAYLALAVCLGCSGNSNVAPVGGEVMLDGQPLAEGRISFISETSRMAVGDVVAGRIENVTTFRPGDGAPLGSHKVVIQPKFTEAEAAAFMRGRPIPKSSAAAKFPSKYKYAASTNLTAEIGPGNNELSFKLESK